MVQQGGGQDDIRISIIIDTIARLQALDATRVGLESLSQRLVQNRNALGQFAKGMKTEFDPSMEKAGKRLSSLLEGFGPRFIGSIQGVNQAFIKTGQTLKQFTTVGLETNAVSPKIANGLTFISHSMMAVGLTGRASTAVIAQLREQLAALIPVTQADREVIAALNTQLNTLATQTVVAAEQQTARLNRELTTTQKAGQGMLLSFALTQGAAGRFSQAMFGLGFAVIFTGLKFLNFVTVLTAVGFAIASILIEKLTNKLSEGAQVTENITGKMEGFRDTLAAVKGESRLLREELASLAAEGEDLAGMFDLLLLRASRQVSFWRAFWTGFKEIPITAIEMIKLAVTGAGDFGIEYSLRRFEALSPAERTQAVLEDMAEAARGIRDKIQEEFRAYEQNLKDVAIEKVVLEPFEVEEARIGRQFDSYIQTVRDKYGELNEVIQDSLSDQIEGRQRATRNEIDVIREGLREEQNVIREALDTQIRVRRDALDVEIDSIRDKAEEKVEIVRNNLEKETDAIRDKLDERIKFIRDRADDEIEVERDRIGKLKDAERELRTVLNDLQSEREQIRVSIIGAEADLATLEREAALLGIGATEEQAIIKARIEGLKAEGDAVDESIRDKEKERSGIEQQIQTIEDLIEAIEDARDSAVDAARDEANARTDAARDAADDIIDAIGDTTNASIKAARSRSDADIREARKAADNQVYEAQRAANAAIQAAQDRSSEDIKAYRETADAAVAESNRIRDNEISNLETTRAIREESNAFARETAQQDLDRSIFLRDTLLPLIENMARLEIIAGTFGTIVPGMSRENRQRMMNRYAFDILSGLFGDVYARQLLESLGMVGGYQLGTRAVPGAMGQPQLVVAHGGERITPPADMEPYILKAGLPALPPPSEKMQVRDIYLTVNVRSEADIHRIKKIVSDDIGQNLNTSIRRGIRSFKSRRIPLNKTFGNR